MSKEYLCYEDFGAVGDGVADDFDAIIACHEEANRTETPVKTKNGAKYYISGRDISAHIRTDVDFGSSEFIIDDRNVERIDSYVFEVDSAAETFTPEIKTLEKGQKKIDFPHEGKVFVCVFDDSHPIYIRKGFNMDNGTPTTDCFTVDADGNIEPGIDWNYPVVTRAYAKSAEDKPITIRGGIFTTIANQGESFYSYHKRGFRIIRSNVTITDITHYVEGELDHGAPYHGFIYVQDSVNVTIKDSLLTPRLIYSTQSKIPGKMVAMGSYDLSLYASVGVKCYNLKQTISIEDKKYWGIYTSNFCKDLVLEDCTLSRFDAHQGVSGLTIRRCKFGHQAMNLIGHGDAVIEDTVVIGASGYVYLRGDYGALWDGDIKISRGQFTPHKNCSDMRIISANNEGDHDYGYECMMGRNITIEDFKIHDTAVDNPATLKRSILGRYDKPDDIDQRPFPYVTAKTLTLKNIITDSGCECHTFADDALYTKTTVIQK